MTYMLISLLIVGYGISLIIIATSRRMFELGSFLFMLGYVGLLTSIMFIVRGL